MAKYFTSRSLMSVAVGVTVAITAVGGVAYAMRPATPTTDPALSVSQDQRSAMLTPAPITPAVADLKQWAPRVSQGAVYGGDAGVAEPLLVPLEEVQIPAVQAVAVASATPSVTPQPQQPVQSTVQRGDDDDYSESSEHGERDSDDHEEDNSDEHSASDYDDDDDDGEGWDD
jgi:hypothetical protein